jgi:chromosome partitioning protein
MLTRTQIIAIVGQKGGSGKTTTTLNLAVAAVEDDLEVAILDLDPQANAANWRDRRTKANPAVISTQSSRLKREIATAQQHGANFIIIDTAGKSDSAAMDAAEEADLILIPLEPHVFHLETLKSFDKLLLAAGAGTKPTYVILNGIHPFATKSTDEARALILDLYEFETCPIHLCKREIYKDSATNGSTPLEDEPAGKAAEEVRRLYNFVKQQLHNLDSSHVENGQTSRSA